MNTDKTNQEKDGRREVAPVPIQARPVVMGNHIVVGNMECWVMIFVCMN